MSSPTSQTAPGARLYDARTSEQFYDERYKGGYMDSWPPEKQDRVAEVIRSLGLPASGEALDFGCGNGIFTDVIRRALPGWEVFGTDLSTVAVAEAARRFPSCRFATPAQLSGRHFDFVFTHHVLEHVYNIGTVWREIAGFMKPGGGALHIAPCGNAGSFEHGICGLRTDGINPEMENRFFYEDEGHVRRLGTARMVELAEEVGLTLSREFYANQHYGAIDWLADAGEEFVLNLTAPERAKDDEARRRLLELRRELTAAARARKVVDSMRSRLSNPSKTLRNRLGILANLPAYLLQRSTDRRVRRRAEEEWGERKGDRGGSEMYLYFTRAGARP